MKLSEMFIGQFVMLTDKCTSTHDSKLPNIGKVVDIALQYDVRIIVGSGSMDKLDVLPVVHFVGEDLPRKVNPVNLCKYKE